MDKWGPPLLFAYRWCLYQLKKKAFEKAHYFTVVGVRWADSKVRRRLQLVDVVKVSRKVAISPILDWTKNQVSGYIRDHGVQLNPCYKLYGHSGNCMFCPYADKKHIALTMGDPEWRGKILPILLKHKEKMMKGSIGRSVYRRWVEGAIQTALPNKIAKERF
jgi:3'-phosphoadenosine 5'-phosphosulfate sulfotransferase (PAPS reductase)/FAD synthetase